MYQYEYSFYNVSWCLLYGQRRRKQNASGNLVKRTGGKVVGPVPLPTKVEKITILRAVHKYKDSREQFESRTHKRLIDVINPTPETKEALKHLDLPSGVELKGKVA